MRIGAGGAATRQGHAIVAGAAEAGGGALLAAGLAAGRARR
jgi:hypothetical protein